LPAFGSAVAFRALGHLLGEGKTRAGVFRFDPAKWRSFHPRSSGWDYPRRSQNAADAEAVVAGEAARVLRVAASSLDPDRPLREYGLDSLRSFELRNLLEATLGIRVPATAMWRHNTIGTLAEYCRAQRTLIRA
jgi:acyl carrier protein